MANNRLKINVGVINCKDCEKFNKAMDIMANFEWSKLVEKAIAFDRDMQEILLDETKVMRIIQMVNPAQQNRKIRLVNQEEFRRVAYGSEADG